MSLEWNDYDGDDTDLDEEISLVEKLWLGLALLIIFGSMVVAGWK